MAINAFDNGLVGLQRGFQTVTTAANQLARQTNGSGTNEAPGAGADIAEELVTQRIGKLETEASAKVVKTADETVGTLIDLFV